MILSVNFHGSLGILIRHVPSWDEFQAEAKPGLMLPVYRELTGDTLTPVSAYTRIEAQGRPGFLFESVVGGEKVGRYSFLGTDPFLEFEARGLEIEIKDHRDGILTRFSDPDPLAALEKWINKHKVTHRRGLPRFIGGAVGMAGYDSVRYVEHLPDTPPDDRGLPDLAFGFYDRMVIFDHIRKTILVVVLAQITEDGSAQLAYGTATRRIDEVVQQLGSPAKDLATSLIFADVDTDSPPTRQVTSNFEPHEFEAMVERCQEYIRAGDIFQVVPSQRFEMETKAHAFDVYRSLRIVNPSPFLFYLPWNGFSLVGSSPEILVRVEDGEMTVRPLAGTRKRGRDEAEDLALEQELLADPKERAEHIMLIDLGRNDVGRVAKFGSVELSEIMHIERYSHVMHISSNVTGELAEGMNAFDALRSGLPAGTVSGAPKIRAMEVIDEMEPQKRGPYGGAVGYIDFSGNMDMCIALRTLVLHAGKAYIQAGCGVVYDSIPAAEYEETVNKARGMIKALQMAEEQLTPE